MDKIKLTIDNKEVEVANGITILDAAKAIGVHIPTLCHMKLHDMGIENKPGGCRVCVVEVEGYEETLGNFLGASSDCEFRFGLRR